VEAAPWWWKWELNQPGGLKASSVGSKGAQALCRSYRDGHLVL